MTKRELAALTQGLAPVLREWAAAMAAQFAACETRERALAARLAVLEATKAAPEAIVGEGFIGPPGPPGPEGATGRDGRDGKDGKDGERGTDGRDGANGQDGKDGIDGMGWDDFEPMLDTDAKTLTLRWTKGERTKTRSYVLPIVVDRGVYDPATVYLKGDGVTHEGAFWIAQEDRPMARPGGTDPASRVWRLAVKRGRDGKPGPQGEKGKDGAPGKDLVAMTPDGLKYR